MLLGVPPLMQDSHTEEPDMGLRTLILLGAFPLHMVQIHLVRILQSAIPHLKHTQHLAASPTSTSPVSPAPTVSCLTYSVTSALVSCFILIPAVCSLHGGE